MAEEISIYRFFSDLGELLKEKDLAVQEGEVDFEEAMRGVRRIWSVNVASRKRRRLLGPRAKEETPLEPEMDVSCMPEFMEGYVSDIDRIVLQRLREGAFSVQATLDLHGLTISQAKCVFADFIREAVRRGLRCVKVIHGRGLRSKGGPTLKNALKGWILMAMHRKWVYGFASARMNEGGPGATIILLKRRPSKKRIEIVG